MINFYPTINRKTLSMSVYSGEWVDVYYEKEETAAADVFEYADAETEQIALLLGFDKKQDIRIFIYDSQKTMQEKKVQPMELNRKSVQRKKTPSEERNTWQKLRPSLLL